MKKFLTITMFMISVLAFSQEKIITGIVKDETGYPMMGTIITVKGTRNATATNMDGKYTIKAAKGSVLVFSYLGMKTHQVTLTDQTTINVTLKDSNEALDEIVVIGYGSVRKSDLTGSVSSVKAEEIAKTGAISLDQALAGKAAGVVVTQGSGEAGGGSTIRVRGMSSLNASEPLYVIDGVPIENTASAGLGGQDMQSSATSPLSMINPTDIKSIEILKDASSTAIYGSRGANGVILITTKIGTVGKGTVTVDHDYGFTEVPNFIKLMDSNQYTIINEEASVNAGLLPRNPARLDSARAGLLKTTDWQKQIIGIGSQSTTNVAFSGGNKDVRYLISNNFLNTKGVVDDTDYKRISTRVNLDAQISENFKVGSNLNYSQVTNNQKAISTGVNVDKGQASAISRALRAAPTTGLLADDDDEGIDLYTPLTSLKANNYNNLLTQLVGSMYAQYNFSKSLDFKTVFTYQNRNTAQRYYQSNTLPDGVAEGGRAKTGDSRATSSTLTNTLNYSLKSKNNRLNAFLGQSIESYENETITVSNFGFANDLLTYYDPGSATFNDPDAVSYSNYKMASYFGRINYTLNNKYLFTITGRFDGASKFAANEKWAFFPAAAIAYKFSEEKFMKNIDAVSEIKFRASYGTSGSQAIQPYQSLDQYGSDLIGINEATTAVYYQNQLPNADLKWETTTQLDLGLDLGFFKNRLTASFEYYNKISNDLLFPGFKIPIQSGFSTYTNNFGALETNGFEASFSANIIDKKNFSWTLSGNVATGKTIVKELPSDYLYSGWNPGYITGGTQRLIVGKEIGTFYAIKRAGIAQFDDFVEFQGLTNEQRISKYNSNPAATYTFVNDYKGGYPLDLTRALPGEQLYEDIDNDQKITENDRTTVGQAQPDITFGINNTFKIGRLDFSFFIDSQQGKDIAYVQNGLKFDEGQGLTTTLNRWTTEDQNNFYPRVDSRNADTYSDRYLHDGSFVRLQNITIGYNFPSEILTKFNLNSLRLYVSGSNIYTWTTYPGYTPDVSLNGSLVTGLGHDNAGYPVSRLIRMGVNVKF